MKKNVLMVIVVVFLVFTLLGVTYAWQGRMDGMGDPVGLISDESDFLINPARIADGKDGKFLSHYGFSYTGVDTNWDAELTGGLIPLLISVLGPGPADLTYEIETDGGKFWNEGLLGGSFSLGSGKMGVFFEYEGEYGDFDGHEILDGSISGLGSANIDFENDVYTDLSDFALRFVYGVPLSEVFKLGTEVKIAYRDEEAQWNSSLSNLSTSPVIPGFPGISLDSSNLPLTGLTRFLLPYDSDYWDLSFKLGLNWKVGDVEFDFAPRGGFIFAGDNEWDSDLKGDIDVGGGNIYPANDFDMDGEVDGWNFGLDFWLRFPVTADTSMPLVFRIDYQEKERDGSGDGDFSGSTTPPGGPLDGLVVPLNWDYNSEETLLTIAAGGGFDIGVSENTNIAIGLFYNYINSETNLEMSIGPSGIPIEVVTETGGYPEYTEHQIKLQFAGEHKTSPCLTMRGGLGIFYGSVSEEYDFDGGLSLGPLSASSLLNNSISLDGNRWGIEASVGATWACENITLEPFINGGYQRVTLDGDEDWSALGIDLLSFDVDKEKDEWFIGGGLSLLFNL